jgi:superfamily II DNA or RNA helicase
MSEIKSYIGESGYVIYKKFFDIKLLDEIRNELTVKPYVHPDFTFGKQVESYCVYLENKNKLYLPKYYGLNKLGKPDRNDLLSGDNIDLTFNGKLKDTQIDPVNTAIKTFNEIGGGILQLPCGHGKTAIALYLISILKIKTLIIVHQEFLLNQWIEKMEQFLPNAKIGIIQQDKIKIEGMDICIGMLQSLSTRNYPSDTFKSFGLLIVDECHHIASQVFCNALKRINTKYQLGLSATPERNDGLTKVFKWYLGDIFYARKPVSNNQNVFVERLIIDSDDDKYQETKLNFIGKADMQGMVTNIVENKNRSIVICHYIKDLVNEKRKILVLSKRREHLNEINKILYDLDVKSVGFYVGRMKQRDLDESAKQSVILGTYHMAQEGLDIPDIDTLVFASPASNIEQAVGRPDRKNHGEKGMKIIDIVDNFSMFINQGKKRLKLYKSRKWNIKNLTVSDKLENNKIKIITK